MSNKILQLKGSFKTDGNHTKPAAPNIPEKGLPVDVDHLRDLKQQLEEILKYNRIGSLKKGIRIAGECLSNENLQYLTDSLRIKQMRIPVSHRHVLLAYQNRKKTALLFWAQFGYISQHFFWTK